MEIIPCREATFLMSKREEDAITLRERIGLYVHLLVCEYCRRFFRQTRLISHEIRRTILETPLTRAEKEKMQKLPGLA